MGIWFHPQTLPKEIAGKYCHLGRHHDEWSTLNLVNKLKPLLQRSNASLYSYFYHNSSDFLFIDNTRAHQTRDIPERIQYKDITCMEWHTSFSDLNPKNACGTLWKTFCSTLAATEKVHCEKNY